MEWTDFILRKPLQSTWSNTTGFLGFLNVNSKLPLLLNHLLFKFKIFIHNSRRSQSLILKSLIREILKVKNIEEKVSINNRKNIRCTKENDSTLKIFWKLKLSDTLSYLSCEWLESRGKLNMWAKEVGFGSDRWIGWQNLFSLFLGLFKYVVYKIGFPLVDNFKKKKDSNKNKKIVIISIKKFFTNKTLVSIIVFVY